MGININAENIFVRKAITDEDLEKVFETRWLGYQGYLNSRDEIEDKADFGPNATLFLATNEDDYPIGTMRILDRNYGEIELDSFLEVDPLLSDAEKSCTETTRLSIPKNPNSVSIFCALAKAYYRYCLFNGIKTWLMSSRPLLAKHYRFLGFKDVGEHGVYYHSKLGNTEHRTYKLSVENIEPEWKRMKHPYYDFFFTQSHSDIGFRELKSTDSFRYPSIRYPSIRQMGVSTWVTQQPQL